MMKGCLFFLCIILILSPVHAEKRRILIDTLHGNSQYATPQLLRVFAEDEIDSSPFSPLNIQMLSNYDVLIITSPHLSYLPSEVSSVCSFVQQGGTLIVLSNGIVSYNLSDILQCFDIEINRDIVQAFQTVRIDGPFSQEPLHFDSPSSLEMNGAWDFVVTVDENGFSRTIDRRTEIPKDYLKNPGSSPIVAAGRRVEKGAVFVIGEVPNFAYSGNHSLMHDISSWLPPRDYGEGLRIYKDIFNFQKSLETYYYKRIPLESSLFLEQAWISYYRNVYSEAEENLVSAQKSLEEKKISPMWFALPVLIVLLSFGFLKYWRVEGLAEMMIFIVGVVMLATSSIFVGMYYNFSSLVIKSFLLLIIFVFGLVKVQRRLLIQAGLFCMMLSVFYFSGFPASSTLGPYYSPEKLIIPQSVSVNLVASDISYLRNRGAITDEISYVEDFVNARVKYRTEDQNYFPTPIATTRHGEGNCFRQALYAASLLIRLGYEAQVVSGIDHAWVEAGGRGILYPKPPAYLRFDASDVSIEYFPSGAFLLLIFLSLVIAYWPSWDARSAKDILILGALSLLFVRVVMEASYIPYHLEIVTFPLYFFLLRFAAKKRDFKLTSTQQFLLKIVIIVLCFFVFVVFPIIATMGRVFTYYYMILVLPLLFTIFMAIFAELFIGVHNIARTLRGIMEPILIRLKKKLNILKKS